MFTTSNGSNIKIKKIIKKYFNIFLIKKYFFKTTFPSYYHALKARGQ